MDAIFKLMYAHSQLKRIVHWYFNDRTYLRGLNFILCAWSLVKDVLLWSCVAVAIAVAVAVAVVVAVAVDNVVDDAVVVVVGVGVVVVVSFVFQERTSVEYRTSQVFYGIIVCISVIVIKCSFHLFKSSRC